jgi:hypothetical protein
VHTRAPDGVRTRPALDLHVVQNQIRRRSDDVVGYGCRYLLGLVVDDLGHHPCMVHTILI